MSLVSSNKIEKNLVEMKIDVKGEDFAKAMDRAYKKMVKTMNVPGFRKGKAPRAIIEKLYGKMVFAEEAVNSSYAAAYAAAVDEAGISPVDTADINVEEVKEDGYTFTAKVTVKPEVELGEYKGIKAEKVVHTVSDEEVDQEIQKLLERNARLVEVTDRAATLGDQVIIDYAGSVDGNFFEGGTAEKQPLELGSGQFIPGFEEQVVGKNIGDEFDVNVTFPEEYHAEELKGKAAVFKVKLHEIKGKEYPALDDEFAKDVSEFDTLEDLKKDTKEKMQHHQEHVAEDAFETQLIDSITQDMKADIPQCMFDKGIDSQLQDFEYRLQAQGMNLDMYMQYTNTTMDTLRKTFEEPAQKKVKIRLALEKIAELENLAPNAEEIEAEYNKMAENYKMDVAKLKSYVPEKELALDLAVNKAIDLVKENAVITEKKDSAKKPAAKKAPAKKAAAKKAEDAAEEKPAAKKTTKKAAIEGTEEKKPAAKKSTSKKAE